MQQQCVICAKPLPIPRRADARYCRSPSTCRVQAFRACRLSDAAAGVFQRQARRRSPSDGTAAGARGMTQLASFRALRQEQKRAAEVASQRAQAERDALVAARQQIERLEAALQEARVFVETERAAAAQAAVRWIEKQRCATQLAEEQRQAIDEATRGREAAQERAAALEERLASTLTEANAERAQSELAMQKDHLLQLCEARAAACALADAARLSGVQAGRSEAEQQIDILIRERDHARHGEAAQNQELTTARQQLKNITAERDQARVYIAEVIAVLQPILASGGRSPSLAAELSAALGKIKGAWANIAGVFAVEPKAAHLTQSSAPAPARVQNTRLARRYPKLDGGRSG